MAGSRLHEIIAAGPVGARAGTPVSGEVRADDARIGVFERRVGETERAGQVAAQIVEHTVGAARQRMQDFARAVLFQIEREALFVTIEALEKMTVIGREKIRPHAAPHVAAVGWILDLDDVGAEIGELHRAVRTGAVLLDGNDTHSRKRQHRRVGPLEHVPEKPALGLDPRVETGFPKRTCDNKRIWSTSRFYLIGMCSRPGYVRRAAAR